MTLSAFCSGLSAFALLMVTFLYLYNVVKKGVTPNAATWTVWGFVTMVNTISYFFVVKGDWVKVATPAASMLGLCGIWGYALIKGRLQPMGLLDTICLNLALFGVLAWLGTGNPLVGNLIFQLVFVISFLPTLYGVWKRTLTELPLPWFLSVVAYLLAIAGIVLDWGETSWSTLAYPVINGVLGNGSVAVLILIRSHHKVDSTSS